MPAKFEKQGISFMYPDNWVVEEDQLGDGGSVTAYSPGGAFWSATVHTSPVDPAELAEAAVSAMKEEYGAVESEAAREEIGGHELVGFDLYFYYLDLTNVACVRSLRTAWATYTIFCQAEDREFEELDPVFHAITTSLLQGAR